LVLNGLKFQLSFSPFCDVASDFREANQLAGFFVTDCVDDNQGPKLGAVFADAPALRFVFSGLASCF